MNEKLRIIMVVALSILSVQLWISWQHDYPPVQAETAQTSTTNDARSDMPDIPEITAANTQNVAPVTPHGDMPVIGGQAAAPAPTMGSENTITVKTDVLALTIDLQGGNILHTTLSEYPVQGEKNSRGVTLLSNDPSKLYIAQSGLISQQGPERPNSIAMYTTQGGQKTFTLAPGQEQLTVPMQWRNPEGVLVTKTFVFKRGDYLIDVNYQVNNNTSDVYRGNLYAQFKRKDVPPPSKGIFYIHPYRGASVSDPNGEHYQKLSFKTMTKENLDKTITGGWLAMQEHYFLGAVIPDAKANNRFYSKHDANKVYTLGMHGPEVTAAPGQSVQTGFKLYLGPEMPDTLRDISPYLHMTIDYGWLWWLSEGLFWGMKQIHKVVGNWGWAIIFITVFIKLIFYPLSAASYRSMAKMKKIAPVMERMKTQYGDDREGLAKATMELYKKEKVNPLGGCLPILIQIPVFIALYWVLIESIFLRQAPFMLWIRDLSLPDPFFILPVLMGATMLIQQKLNPTPPDPTQAKVMMLLPVVFTVLFLYFPAGLVLYWVVNNGLSILQQWYITRQFGHMNSKGNGYPVKT